MITLRQSHHGAQLFITFLKMSYVQLSLVLSLITGLVTTVQAEVVTSIRPLAFISTAITDGVTETKVLLPDGASPHAYAMRPSDIQILHSADIFVWIGPEMEVFLTKSIKHLNKNQLLTLSDIPQIAQMINNEQHDENHLQDNDVPEYYHDHHNEDMHIWMSPKMAKYIASSLSIELIKQYPQSQDKIRRNLQEFNYQLEQTEEKIGNMLNPLKGKRYFVFHDAYGYFEKNYGLNSLGHFTINPEIPPGAKRLNQIREMLKQNQADCIFSEPQFKPMVINTVTQGTPVRHGVLDPLGSNIELSKNSYMQFLEQLSQQFANCLKHDV